MKQCPECGSKTYLQYFSMNPIHCCTKCLWDSIEVIDDEEG